MRARFGALVCVFPSVAFGSVLHVDATALRGGDGASWQTAYRFLSDALSTAAQSGVGVTEIRVAQGSYRPDQSETNPAGTLDRDASLILASGIALRGGYAGAAAPDPDLRDPTLYPAVLTGDLLGDDGPDFAGRADNAKRVVTSIATAAGTELDGFTIRGAEGPAVVYPEFLSNEGGGGVRAVDATLTLRSLKIVDNRAGMGAGAFAANSAIVVEQCTFQQNRATFLGGGLIARDTSATVANSTFTANEASYGGAGAFLFDLADNGSAAVTGCSFVGNIVNPAGVSQPAVGGVGGLGIYGCEFTVASCAFASNHVTPVEGEDNLSGALQLATSDGTVAACSFESNIAKYGGAIEIEQSSHVTLDGCTFRLNSADGGAGGAVFVTRPDVPSTVHVLQSLFELNWGGGAGGAIFAYQSTLDVVECTCRANGANLWGGAIGLNNVTASIIGSVCDANVSNVDGGGIAAAEGTTLFLDHCLVSRNKCDRWGGGIYLLGSATIVNSILYDNVPGWAGFPELFLRGLGTAEVSYCDVKGGPAQVGQQGGPLVWGQGNIDADPALADPDGPDGIHGTNDDDLRLFPTSPCIDAGSNASVPNDQFDIDHDGNTREPLPLDLSGSSRFVDDPLTADTGSGLAPVVDLGPYEFQPNAGPAAGIRTWINPVGGFFGAESNWSPLAPLASNGTLFGIDATYVVDARRPIATSSSWFLDGDVSLALHGNDWLVDGDLVVGQFGARPAALHLTSGAVSASNLRIGVNAASEGTLSVSNAGISASATLHLGELGSGSLLMANATVTANAMTIGPLGVMSGDGVVTASVSNGGTVAPFGTLSVNGAFVQASPTFKGTMRSVLDGTGRRLSADRVAIEGTATLGGALVVSAGPSLAPAVGARATVLSASALVGAFEIALLPGVGAGRFARVEYGGVLAGVSGADIVVDALANFYGGLESGAAAPIDGEPVDAVLADFDLDGDADLALSIPSATGSLPGSVVVLLNAGIDRNGTWLGFSGGTIQVTVGVQPAGITSGFFNADAAPDLAVVNTADGTASVLLNANDGQGHFAVSDTLPAALTPQAIAALDLDGDGFDELAVTAIDASDGGAGVVLVIANNGLGSWIPHIPFFPAGTKPTHICTLDVNDDRIADLVAIDPATNTVVVLLRIPDGYFGPFQSFPVGPGSTALSEGDLNGDGAPEILTASPSAAAVSILVNQSSGGTLALNDAVLVPVDVPVRSLVLADIDGDGDRDIGLAAGALGVRVLRNDTASPPAIALTLDESFSFTGDATLVRAADVDLSGVADLVVVSSAVNDSAGPPPAQAAALLSPITRVLGDLDGDGSVNGSDLAILLGSWGFAAADLTGNGVVDGEDLALLLGAWTR